VRPPFLQHENHEHIANTPPNKASPNPKRCKKGWPKNPRSLSKKGNEI